MERTAFALCAAVLLLHSLHVRAWTVVTTSASAATTNSLPFIAHEINNGVSPGDAYITFNIPGAGPHSIPGAYISNRYVSIDGSGEDIVLAGTLTLAAGGILDTLGVQGTVRLYNMSDAAYGVRWCTFRGGTLTVLTNYTLRGCVFSNTTVNVTRGCRIWYSDLNRWVGEANTLNMFERNNRADRLAGTALNIYGPSNHVYESVLTKANCSGSWLVFVSNTVLASSADSARFVGDDSRIAHSVFNTDWYDSLEILGNRNLIEHNVSYSNKYGLYFEGDGNTVRGNRIGTDAAGTAAMPNFYGGIQMYGGVSNRIGGATTAEFNTVCANVGFGILVALGDGAMVHGNYVGLDVNGQPLRGNTEEGISVFGGSNHVIGVAGMPANYICGNGRRAIAVTAARDTLVQGNIVGFTPATNIVSGNGTDGAYDGIFIEGSPHTRVVGNIVGGQSNGYGIAVSYSSHSVEVTGNRVGVSAGEQLFGNARGGIYAAATNVLVGGTNAAARNIVCGNAGAGIVIDNGGPDVRVQGNHVGLIAGGYVMAANTNGIMLTNVYISGVAIGGAFGPAGNVIGGNNNAGLILDGCIGVAVEGNIIGLSPDGAYRRPNAAGMIVRRSSNNRIGGDNYTLRNVISGNDGDGLVLTHRSTNNVVWGNYIGTGTDGTQRMHNAGHGIHLAGESSYRPERNYIGGDDENGSAYWREGNVIAGNEGDGIRAGKEARYNWIDGNAIGVDVAGRATLGNGGNGIMLNEGRNLVGARFPNVICGNNGDGIRLDDAGWSTVAGNLIGVDRHISTNMGNWGCGILLTNSAIYNDIGLALTGGCNIIADNWNHGIFAGENCTGNEIRGNFIACDQYGSSLRQNRGDGIVVQGNDGGWIGGLSPVLGNVINAGTALRCSSVSNAYAYNNAIGFNPYSSIPFFARMDYGIVLTGCHRMTFGQFNATNTVSCADSAAVWAQDCTGIVFSAMRVGLWDYYVGGTNDGDGVVLSNCISCSISDSIIAGSRIGLFLVDTTNTSVYGSTIGWNGSHWMREYGNREAGIRIIRGRGDRVGTAYSDAGRNVIADNHGDGIDVIDSSGVRIEGNHIGVDFNGTTPRTNDGIGVCIVNSTGVRLGADTSRRNYIAGNRGGAVSLTGGTDCVVAGNRIGMGNDGATRITNFGFGVRIVNSARPLVGGVSAVYGNYIGTSAGDAVRVEGAGSIAPAIHGNAIGVMQDGVTPAPNGGAGIAVIDAPGASVGMAGSPNIVGGSAGDGILVAGIGASNAVVFGNSSGMSGGALLANAGNGIAVRDAAGCVISNNLVGGNGGSGVAVLQTAAAPSAMHTVLSQNAIGLSAAYAPVPNAGDGVLVSNAGWTLIAPLNVIGGNYGAGIAVVGLGAHDTRMYQNLIGIAPNLVDPRGNHGHGVALTAGNANRVGGTNWWEPNRIANNWGNGIDVALGANDSLWGNAISNNGLMGINLGPQGRTYQPEQDGMPNRYQRYPVLSTAYGGAQTVINGVLTSSPSAVFTLEFFRNSTTTRTGYAEGQSLLGRAEVATDGGGVAPFSIAFPAVSVEDDWITATATDTNRNTSEFSVPVRAVAAFVSARFTVDKTLALTGQVVQFTDQSLGSPTAWGWDFDNNGSIDSAQKNPVHAYASPGIKSVRLVASNALSSSALVRTNLITVGGAMHVVTNPAVRVQDVIDASAPFDQIVLEGGTYTAAGRVHNGGNVLVLDKPVTVMGSAGQTADATVIDGQGSLRCAYVIS
ncbi:PKD domain-containing protein, partial [bacterium]|nr:PKD domain-containing protein [bacterium]